MITLISYIIATILILNGHGWWGAAFFVIGTIALCPGEENETKK